MDSINPHNLPTIRWSGGISRPSPIAPEPDPATNSLPSDQVSLQARPLAEPEAPALPAPPSTAGSTPARVEPGVERAAQAYGLSLTSTGGLTQLDERPPAVDLEEAPATRPGLSDWLNARARPVFSAESLDNIAGEIQPLVSLLSGAPDPQRWNPATWSCFQLASHLPKETLTEVAHSIESGKPTAFGVPLGLQLGLSDPQVDRDTLVRMIRLRSFASQIVEGELPTLSPGERDRYLEMVHDQGYALPQQARARETTTLLCSLGSPELLDPQQLALLPPALAERFSQEGRAPTSDFMRAFPRLSLGDFFGPEDAGDARSREQALSFLHASGKQVDEPSAELGGQSMREFLRPQEGENREKFLQRLSGKQVANALARPWKELQADVVVLESRGADGEALKRELERRQTPALAPILLMLNAPSLLEQARAGGEQASQAMDGLMQVFYRATNPHLGFEEPLIGLGQAQLQQTHQEQLAKDRLQWTSVVSLKKTPVLAGLSDGVYDQRTAGLPQRPMDELEDHVETALGRLKRDLGEDSPAFAQIVSNLELANLDQDAVTLLHALRFDPTSFAVEVPEGQGQIRLGERNFSLATEGSKWVPEFVSATSVAFRVRSETGEDALLRLPKGSRPTFAEDGQLKLEVFDRERYTEVAARLQDFQYLDARVDMTARELVEFEGGVAVLEDRSQVPDAGLALQQGGKLKGKDVDALVDQWLAGTAEIDAETRPYGVLYELGPDNYTLGQDGLQGSYVDVALPFRNQRERASFGFVTGGYGSAANWVVADNQPLSQQRVEQVWKGEQLSPAEADRRQLFVQAFQERLDPHHPVWKTLPTEHRARCFASFQEDVVKLGLDLGGDPPAQPGAGAGR